VAVPSSKVDADDDYEMVKLDLSSQWLLDSLNVSRSEMRKYMDDITVAETLKDCIKNTRGKRTRLLAVVNKEGAPSSEAMVTIDGYSLRVKNTLKALWIEATEDNLQWLFSRLHSEISALRLIASPSRTPTASASDHEGPMPIMNGDNHINDPDDDAMDEDDEDVITKIELVKKDKARSIMHPHTHNPFMLHRIHTQCL
jgi:hypothetical protein